MRRFVNRPRTMGVVHYLNPVNKPKLHRFSFVFYPDWYLCGRITIGNNYGEVFSEYRGESRWEELSTLLVIEHLYLVNESYWR